MRAKWPSSSAKPAVAFRARPHSHMWRATLATTTAASANRSGQPRQFGPLSNNKNKETIMNLPKHLLPTTVVGSYPQPEWLVDRAMLSKSVPRTRMHAMWRLPAEHLEEAQDDATIVAIRDMERAGIDVVTDGEIRRESYSNRFATALEGIDADNPAPITARHR